MDSQYYTISEQVVNHRKLLETLKELEEKKAYLLAHINSLPSVDLSKTKVMNGSRKPTSPQEMYAIRLEKVNRELAEYRAAIDTNNRNLRPQLERLKYRYCYILEAYFFNFKDWNYITENIFRTKEDLYLESNKPGHYIINPNYYRQVMYWRKRALEELEKLDRKQAFIPVENKQLRMDLIN